MKLCGKWVVSGGGVWLVCCSIDCLNIQFSNYTLKYCTLKMMKSVFK